MHIAIVTFYTIFITFVSLQPGDSMPSVGSWDKVGHFLAYAVFAVLAYHVVKNPRQYLTVCLVIIAFSGLMEVAQSFMPGRMMSAYDLLANALGVAVGAFIARATFRAHQLA
ncbi:MAG: VanZ family protein [Halioglobus sp.]